MIAIHTPPPWRLPERAATPESVHADRRRFLRDMGLLGLGAAGVGGMLATGCGAQTAGDPGQGWAGSEDELLGGGLYPTPRNEAFSVDRAITDETTAATYNNFYEFTIEKGRVWRMARDFTTRPWEVEVGGLVESPTTFDIDDLERTMPLEERVYRFRCVEAWSMTVPWTGFLLRALAERVRPTAQARFVRFVTVHRPEQMRGQREDLHYPWPYYEALRMDEAMNDLTLVATGIYGHRLSPQHGAPLRLVVPWKYGYKSIKSIVRIEFTAERPPTFWNDLQPREYSFLSNVDPAVPHPRWSQASERVIGSGNRVDTLPFNGYGEQVASMYA